MDCGTLEPCALVRLRQRRASLVLYGDIRLERLAASDLEAQIKPALLTQGVRLARERFKSRAPPPNSTRNSPSSPSTVRSAVRAPRGDGKSIHTQVLPRAGHRRPAHLPHEKRLPVLYLAWAPYAIYPTLRRYRRLDCWIGKCPRSDPMSSTTCSGSEAIKASRCWSAMFWPTGHEQRNRTGRIGR